MKLGSCPLLVVAVVLSAFASSCAVVPRTMTQPVIDGTHPRGTVSFRTSHGTSDIELETGADDDTSGNLGGLYFEAVPRNFGGGFQFEVSESDDDVNLFGGGNEEIKSFSIFPHFTARALVTPRFRIPVRVGPQLAVHTSETNSASVSDADFGTFGVLFEVEPEFDLVRDRPFAASVYGSLRAGVGNAIVDVDDEEFDTDSRTFGAEVGFRFQIGAFLLAAGFTSRQTVYDRSDAEFVGGSLVEIVETEFRYTGVFFNIGARW